MLDIKSKSTHYPLFTKNSTYEKMYLWIYSNFYIKRIEMRGRKFHYMQNCIQHLLKGMTSMFCLFYFCFRDFAEMLFLSYQQRTACINAIMHRYDGKAKFFFPWTWNVNRNFSNIILCYCCQLVLRWTVFLSW